MNKTVTTFFALIGIFLCGAIVGGVVAVRYANVTVQKKAADRQLSDQQWVRLTNRLNPTEEQKQQIRALVTNYMEARQKSRAIDQSATKTLDEGIRAMLTPEQAAEYERIRARNKENERLWQRWIREQRAKYGESPMVAPKSFEPKERKEGKESREGKAPKDGSTAGANAPEAGPK